MFGWIAGHRIARTGDRASGGGGNDFVRAGRKAGAGKMVGPRTSLTRCPDGHHTGHSVSQDHPNLSAKDTRFPPIFFRFPTGARMGHQGMG